MHFEASNVKIRTYYTFYAAFSYIFPFFLYLFPFLSGQNKYYLFKLCLCGCVASKNGHMRTEGGSFPIDYIHVRSLSPLKWHLSGSWSTKMAVTLSAAT